MAVEAAGVKDVDSAERLALAAYQAGEFELAQRWIKRAHNTPVAQWLQAKLYLRAGKVAPAAALFAQARGSVAGRSGSGSRQIQPSLRIRCTSHGRTLRP